MSTSNRTVTKPYIWRMQTGQTISVDKMLTSHLFYSVRMIFNHTVPLEYAIPNCKRYRLHLDAAQRRTAVAAMLAELARRDDILPEHLEQIKHMANVYTKLNIKYLVNEKSS